METIISKNAFGGNFSCVIGFFQKNLALNMKNLNFLLVCVTFLFIRFVSF